jgi:UDP-2,3-diacylglucosamine pyrophosphatase LpxH
MTWLLQRVVLARWLVCGHSHASNIARVEHTSNSKLASVKEHWNIISLMPYG